MQCVKCKNQQGRYYFAHIDKWDTCPCCDGKWENCKTCEEIEEVRKTASKNYYKRQKEKRKEGLDRKEAIK